MTGPASQRVWDRPEVLAVVLAAVRFEDIPSAARASILQRAIDITNLQISGPEGVSDAARERFAAMLTGLNGSLIGAIL